MSMVGIPQVSVVIPVFNRAATIGAALDSVLRQTFADLEVIVVDDGSTDGTRDMLAAVADPRVRVLLLPENRGVSGARNAGIAAARGPWVAFQDSDDEWLPRKLEKQMARLAAAPPGTVACGCGMLTLWTLEPLPGRAAARRTVLYVPDPAIAAVEGDIRASLRRASLASTQTLVARRDTLLAAGGFDTALRALVDWDLAIRLAAVGAFAFVDEPLVLQSFSENSITRDRARRVQARIRLLDKHDAFFRAEPRVLWRQHLTVAGDCYRLGDLAGARAALARAARLRPLHPRPWLHRLRLLWAGLRG
jgi:glycosyltransferase involved in cell wall biosynthesis